MPGRAVRGVVVIIIIRSIIAGSLTAKAGLELRALYSQGIEILSNGVS